MLCRRHRRCRFDPWVPKISWGGNGSPLQYSCLNNPLDRGAWWATVFMGSQRFRHNGATKHTGNFLVSCFSGGSVEKNPPAMQETWVWSLSWEDPLEKDMAMHSRILASWTEKADVLQSVGSQRDRTEWLINSNTTNPSLEQHEASLKYSAKGSWWCLRDL